MPKTTLGRIDQPPRKKFSLRLRANQLSAWQPANVSSGSNIKCRGSPTVDFLQFTCPESASMFIILQLKSVVTARTTNIILQRGADIDLCIVHFGKDNLNVLSFSLWVSTAVSETEAGNSFPNAYNGKRPVLKATETSLFSDTLPLDLEWWCIVLTQKRSIFVSTLNTIDILLREARDYSHIRKGTFTMERKTSFNRNIAVYQSQDPSRNN